MGNSGDFASMFEAEKGARRTRGHLEPGQQVEGTVLALSGGLVILDIGSHADATIDLAEFDERPVKVGDRIRATVASARSDAPRLTLSLGRGGANVSSEVLRLAKEGGTPVSGTVTAAVKGGFSIDLAGTRAFCPISQIDVSFVTEPESFVGQTFDFRVIEYAEGGRNIVVSRRAQLEEERKAAALALSQTLEVGATVTGTIKSLVKVGAIVDLGGLDGFIHVSELAHVRVASPEDVVSVGETVEARVLRIEQGERGLSVRLSLKSQSAPAQSQAPAADEVLPAEIVRHVDGGVIVSTSHGEGFVSTRELSLAPGSDHRRAYPLGKKLDVVLVSRDAASGKLRFSVDKVAGVEERKNLREFGGGAGKQSFGSLGDLLKGKLGGLSAGPNGDAKASPKAQNPALRRGR